MRILALLLALLPLSAFAEPESSRTCRLVFLGERGAAPDTVQLFDGKKVQEVELPGMNLSKAYKLPGGAIKLTLLAKPPVEGQPLPPEAPSATVADGVESLYLLIIADPANKVLPLRMTVLDASSSHFKAGQMMWYNLTRLEVVGKVGDQQIAIKSAAHAVTDAPSKASGDYPVDLAYRRPGETKTFPIFETRWIHEPGARSIVFIYGEPNNTVPRVVAFRDTPDPKEKEGAHSEVH
jgi:hypothetical protein